MTQKNSKRNGSIPVLNTNNIAGINNNESNRFSIVSNPGSVAPNNRNYTRRNSKNIRNNENNGNNNINYSTFENARNS
jgi:hypothetical protein